MKNRSLCLAFSIAAAFAVACGSSDTTSEMLDPGPNEIVVGNALSFMPARLTVTAGTTIRWSNVGGDSHTVTSGLSSRAVDAPGADFDQPLAPGRTLELTFNTPGEHPFFCRPHEGMGMKGVITVVAAPPPDAGSDDVRAAVTHIIAPPHASDGFSMTRY